MLMHNIIIGTSDITDYIVDGSYSMDSNAVFESWKDGNYVEHRIIVASKVKGSFNVACSNETLSLSDLYDLFDNAANNGVITATVYVTNTGATEAISAYYALKNADHIIRADGTYIDIVTVEIPER